MQKEDISRILLRTYNSVIDRTVMGVLAWLPAELHYYDNDGELQTIRRFKIDGWGHLSYDPERVFNTPETYNNWIIKMLKGIIYIQDWGNVSLITTGEDEFQRVYLKRTVEYITYPKTQ